MEEPDEGQKDARKFLLGYLDERERQLVEERVSNDLDYLECILEVEHELMENYLARELSETDRLRFEKHVLTNQRQVDQLNLTRALGAFAQVQAAANSPPVAARTEPVR